MKKFLTAITVLALLPVNFAFASESESETETETTEVAEMESETDQEANEAEAESEEETQETQEGVEASSIEDYYGLYEREQNYKSLKLDLESKLADLSDEEFYDLALQIAHHTATGEALEASVFDGYTAEEAPEADPAPSTSTFAFTLTAGENGEATFTDINKETEGAVSQVELEEYASEDVEAAYDKALAVEGDNGRKLVYFYEEDKAIVVNTLATSQSIFVSQYTRTEANPENIEAKVQEIVEYNESLN